MRILVGYRGIPQSPGWATGDSVVRAFRQLGYEAHAYAKYYKEEEWIEDPKSLEGQRWDLILMMECNDGDRFYAELFDQTRFPCRQFATWFFDICGSKSYLNGWASLVAHRINDKHFVANEEAKKILLGSQPDRVHFLPYATDPALHLRRDLPKKYDFTLVGSDRPERRELIQGLKAAGLQANLISDVFREDYIDTLAESTVSLCDVAGGGDGLLPMRVFEAPAAGSLLLTVAGQGAERVLNGYARYYDPNGLRDACLGIVADWEKTKSLAKAGQEHVLLHHTYEKRCEAILETCFEFK